MRPARLLIVCAVIAALCTTLGGCSALLPKPGPTPKPTPEQSLQLLNHNPSGKPIAHCVSNLPTAGSTATPTTTATPTPQPTTRDARETLAEVAQAQSVAMPEPQFWALIDVLHGSDSDASYRRLKLALEAGPSSDLIPFEARLDLSLYALDDECRESWFDTHDPSGLGHLEDDDFLYLRAATITAGRANYDQAITTDTLPWGHTDVINTDGELLLYVANEAAEHDGIRDKTWFDEAPFVAIYETGSNPAGWPSSSS